MQENLNLLDIKKKGSKQEVWDGLAIQTSGGLKKEDLILNKKGKIVSKKLSENGLKNILKNRKKSEAKEDKLELDSDNLKEEPIEILKEENSDIKDIGEIQPLEKSEGIKLKDVQEDIKENIIIKELPNLENQPSEAEVLHMDNPKRKIRKVIHKEKKEKL